MQMMMDYSFTSVQIKSCSRYGFFVNKTDDYTIEQTKKPFASPQVEVLAKR